MNATRGETNTTKKNTFKQETNGEGDHLGRRTAKLPSTLESGSLKRKKTGENPIH